uniref:Uncharacterized protein n=1 Tax=Myripristis murdjan TaxID=586833 RepID=A0A667Z308_9TELE
NLKIHGKKDGPPGPSPELLASLQALGDSSDDTLLPQSLHQVYQWAVQFLQLEKLYHERLLSNLAALQDNWGTACNDFLCSVDLTDSNGLCLSHIPDNKPETTHQDEGEAEQSVNAEPEQLPPHTDHQGQGEEEEGGEEETYEEGQEVGEEEEEEEDLCEETPEEEEVKVEWPTGVPQASAKDLYFRNHKEAYYICALSLSVHNADEVGGDSCLILLLLCLVTVVISIGGTALYCTLVDTYSNICTDFSHNVDFYVMNVRRFFDELRHWLPFRT